MSAAPEVVGTADLNPGAPWADALSLTVVGDGFTAADQAEFEGAVEALIGRLAAEELLADHLDALAVRRIDVLSAESGITNPNIDEFRDTALGVSHLPGVPHGLTLEQETVRALARDHAPGWDAVLVLGKSDSLAGSAFPGGLVAACTVWDGWLPIALHELGHLLFGLGDEYDYPFRPDQLGHERHSGIEPGDPNLTTDVATPKWDRLRTLATAETHAPDCAYSRHSAGLPYGADEVGAFEGADHHHCGAFRPSATCIMRDTGVPRFCPVCRHAIAERLERMRV